MHSVLIVDDDDFVLKSLARLLRSQDLAISYYHDPLEALIQCTTREFDLIISDQRMPGMLGTEFFRQIEGYFPQTRRILISGYSDFNDVVGAFNDDTIHKFVLKPWNNVQLKTLVAEQLQLKDEGAASASQLIEMPGERQAAVDSFHGIVTQDPVMLDQLSLVSKAAKTDAPIFINGETGTGKEMVARAVHLESKRRDKQFVALNCANLTETLLESQLFGHKKGAFTGADQDQGGVIMEAEGGTLFLDEVVEIPMSLQAKLLRVLQEREYTPIGETKTRKFDVKVLSAAALNLETAVHEGKFREDLRFRLEVIPISLPSLRDRGVDIRLLFDYCLAGQFERHGLSMVPIEDAVYEKIQTYSWPGNVRELVNVCTYIAALAGADCEEITLTDLPVALNTYVGIPEPAAQRVNVSASSTAAADDEAPQINRASLEEAIEAFDGHREKIAAHFGISRMTLWRKMKKYGLA